MIAYSERLKAFRVVNYRDRPTIFEIVRRERGSMKRHVLAQYAIGGCIGAEFRWLAVPGSEWLFQDRADVICLGPIGDLEVAFSWNDEPIPWLEPDFDMESEISAQATERAELLKQSFAVELIDRERDK